MDVLMQIIRFVLDFYTNVPFLSLFTSGDQSVCITGRHVAHTSILLTSALFYIRNWEHHVDAWIPRWIGTALN